jgi:CPA2 family monovalent cation:H+ antiporter-2
VQMLVATALGTGVGVWWGWSLGAALVFGLSLSVASTVVLLKALEAQGALETSNGRIAVGWLVVEDLAMVLVLVLLPPLAGLLGGTTPDAQAAGSPWGAIGRTLLEVAAFVAVMLVAGRRAVPWLLWHVSRTGSRELFTLSVVACAIGIAFASAKLFSVSFALGAFFAGMVMRESEFSARAAEESLPLRDAFSVLFFVSVGMLFDPAVLLERPLQVLAVVGIVVVGKSLAAAALVVAFRHPLRTALTVSGSLAQIGEFSFILAGLGAALGLMPPEGMNLVVAGALISIAINPFVMASAEPLARALTARSAWARALDARRDPSAALPPDTGRDVLTGHVVIVGCGRVGRQITAALREDGLPVVVVDLNRERIESLREAGIAAVSGDASEPEVLVQAHVATASMLVVAIPDTVGLERMVATARTLNPGIGVVVRSHGESESRLMRDAGIGTVFSGEEELARSMVGHVKARCARPAQAGH